MGRMASSGRAGRIRRFLKRSRPERDKGEGYITDKFWVRFSRPVRRDTLRPDCFAMTIMSSEERDGWWQPDRVPIIGVDTTGFTDPGDPAVTCAVRG